MILTEQERENLMKNLYRPGHGKRRLKAHRRKGRETKKKVYQALEKEYKSVNTIIKKLENTVKSLQVRRYLSILIEEKKVKRLKIGKRTYYKRITQ